MSYDPIRQSIPEVYNYGGNVNTSGYVQPAQPVQRQLVNEFRTSNVQPVNLQRTSNVQPVVISQPAPTNIQKTSQFKGSKAQ